MNKSLIGFLACLWIAPVLADVADPASAPAPEPTPLVAPVPEPPPLVAPAAVATDSLRMERDLQSLPWEQFREVIASVPRMKAEVDAYGLLGWSYVQANYRTYAWRKNIDRLDAAQRAQLLELIRIAKGDGATPQAPADL